MIGERRLTLVSRCAPASTGDEHHHTMRPEAASSIFHSTRDTTVAAISGKDHIARFALESPTTVGEGSVVALCSPYP